MLPSEGPFTYTLRALDAKGRTSELVSRTFELSTNLDTTAPLQPLVSPTTLDAPDLRWGAVVGAAELQPRDRQRRHGQLVRRRATRRS